MAMIATYHPGPPNQSANFFLPERPVVLAQPWFPPARPALEEFFATYIHLNSLEQGLNWNGLKFIQRRH
jgi:hypothetical protein